MKSIIDSSINIRAMYFVIEFLLTKFWVVIWQHIGRKIHHCQTFHSFLLSKYLYIANNYLNTTQISLKVTIKANYTPFCFHFRCIHHTRGMSFWKYVGNIMGSMLLAIAAMLSKETGITVLGVCILYDIFILFTKKRWKYFLIFWENL